ncbi:MAG: GTP cyclohydrolase I FolE2, partial [Bdellovibrio sp. CG10_big_fil_rev_8_21_14_0_10_47_8]
VPVLLAQAGQKPYMTPGRAQIFVSLENTESRGIHMSRLFKELQESLSHGVLSFTLLKETLSKFLQTHEGLSQKAKIEIEFQAMIQRRALKSDNQGWRTYPVKISAFQERGHEARFYLETLVTYSSTCPASAALARQLIQENFKQNFRQKDLDFKEIYDFMGSTDGINATPHAQRSEARVKIEVSETSFGFEKLIDLIEAVLQTPVQTVVKREDEQEFALRNGQNLMFCEDAARRIQVQLMKEAAVLDFVAELRHLESLHPHDAVSWVSRGRELKGF